MADNQQLKKSKQGIIYKEKPTLKLLTLGATKTKKTINLTFIFLKKRSVVSPSVLFNFKNITIITRQATKIAATMAKTHQTSAQKMIIYRLR